MIASHNGHVDVVNVLLQHGASVHLQDKVKLHILVHMPHNYGCVAMYIFCISLTHVSIHNLLYFMPVFKIFVSLANYRPAFLYKITCCIVCIYLIYIELQSFSE